MPDKVWVLIGLAFLTFGVWLYVECFGKASKVPPSETSPPDESPSNQSPFGKLSKALVSGDAHCGGARQAATLCNKNLARDTIIHNLYCQSTDDDIGVLHAKTDDELKKYCDQKNTVFKYIDPNIISIYPVAQYQDGIYSYLFNNQQAGIPTPGGGKCNLNFAYVHTMQCEHQGVTYAYCPTKFTFWSLDQIRSKSVIELNSMVKYCKCQLDGKNVMTANGRQACNNT